MCTCVSFVISGTSSLIFVINLHYWNNISRYIFSTRVYNIRTAFLLMHVLTIILLHLEVCGQLKQ